MRKELVVSEGHVPGLEMEIGHVHYCDAHALMRISDCEDDELMVVLSADEYDNAAPQDD